VADTRFNPRAGFGRYHLNGGNELVAGMRSAVCPGKRDGGASWFFLLNSGSEFVARLSVVSCLGKRVGIASRLFLLNSGHELIAKINHIVCPRKFGGRVSWPFRISGNLGRARSFRASLAIAALHGPTIVTQRVQRGLSTARRVHSRLIKQVGLFVGDALPQRLELEPSRSVRADLAAGEQRV